MPRIPDSSYSALCCIRGVPGTIFNTFSITVVISIADPTPPAPPLS